MQTIILAVIFFQQNPVPLVHCGHLPLVCVVFMVLVAVVSPTLVVVVVNVTPAQVVRVVVVDVTVVVITCMGTQLYNVIKYEHNYPFHSSIEERNSTLYSEY